MIEQSNNKRIAKNTMILYFRMLLTMGVSLYTSRVILSSLGISDFGLYSVIGGVVATLSFFVGSISSSFQRFFCVELGKKHTERLKELVGSSILIIVVISIFIILISETLGLWFVKNKLVIPNDRVFQAVVVFQFSLFTFIASLFQSIYNAIIISYEKMNVFAYISVFDVFAKLFVAISIGFFPENRLIYYSGFVFLVSLISLIIYYCYCRYSYEVTKGIFTKNKKLFFEIFSFSGWTLLGTAANVLKSNGLNVLLNLFFGTVVNAARGISYQIYAAIRSFTSSLQMAFSPQIIKSYAENNFSYMQKLTLTASKMSYYFMLLLSVPVFVDTNLILSLWLGNNVPEHTISFTKIVILTGLIDNLAAPIVNILYANGKIKMYQIIVSAVMLLVIPLSYLILKLNYPPESALLVSLFLTIIAHGVRLFFLKKYISFHISRYVKEVIIPVFGFTLFLVFSPSIISSISVCKSSIYSYILTIVTIEIIFVIIIYLFGLRTDERNIINRNFKKYRINAKN